MKRIALILCLAAAVIAPVFAQEVEPPRIDVSANSFQFVPNEITIRQNVTITLRLTSVDFIHRLHSKDLAVDVDLRPNQPHDVTITPAKTGRFELICGQGRGAKMVVNVVP